jgi:hypothetical protein
MQHVLFHQLANLQAAKKDSLNLLRMRSPNRRRPLPNKLLKNPDKSFLNKIAERVSYIGSVEHKDTANPLLHQPLPHPRPDASICPRNIRSIVVVNKWLKDAIAKGAISAFFEGEFPRYVWFKNGNQAFMGRLINKIQGEYKGFPIEPFECPNELNDIYG